jgi:transcriptional regulator with XRE-family HTH domain
VTAEQWMTGRLNAGLTQVSAARSLNVSQPYLSQLETGLRAAGADLACQAASLYALPPTVLPLPEALDVPEVQPDCLQQDLAALGYPGFEHLRSRAPSNPAKVVLSALVKPDLDTRLTEALPWVICAYSDLDWAWLRDRAKLRNAQNKLAYVVNLARETVRVSAGNRNAVHALSGWLEDLEDARLAREGTLCRDSMPERERGWLRENRPPGAVHWSLLTSLTAGQLPYAAP